MHPTMWQTGSERARSSVERVGALTTERKGATVPRTEQARGPRSKHIAFVIANEEAQEVELRHPWDA